MQNNQIKLKRCGWAEKDPLSQKYHDQLWGKPVYDADQLFKMLILEGAQAGLSWLTILKRWSDYEEAFHNFDAKKMAAMGEGDILNLMVDSGIIRNRLKIESAISNAKIYLKLKGDGINFSKFLWDFVGGEPKVNHPQKAEDFLAQSEESIKMSKALKKLGFSFVGPTICYAFMQAVGMVDDHEAGCFLHH